MKKTSIILAIIILTGCAHDLKWSRADKMLLVASWTAATADYSTTKSALENPNNYEMNPIMGEHPSNTTLATYMLSSQIITTILAHYFPRYRKAILGVKTTINTGCALHNSTLDK